MDVVIGLVVLWFAASFVIGIVGAILKAIFGHSPGTWK